MIYNGKIVQYTTNKCIFGIAIIRPDGVIAIRYLYPDHKNLNHGFCSYVTQAGCACDWVQVVM